MSRCPNCRIEMVGAKCYECGTTWDFTPSYVCPDCGAKYYGVIGKFQFCPACKMAKEKLEQEYWDDKRAGMRSIAGDIVAKTLAQIERREN